MSVGGRQEVISASTRALIGAPVVDIHRVRVGKIEDLIIDLRTGRIAYAALSLESHLPGSGRPGCVLLPWNALILDGVENTFTLDMDPDLLQEMGLFASLVSSFTHNGKATPLQ